MLTGVATTFFVLPTLSKWTVLWNNSYLCDGYDSLCYCMTRFHGVDTLHWDSSDTDGPFLAGTSFSYRGAGERGKVTRSVSCCSGGSRWPFEESGTVMLGEPTESHTTKHKRDRLNEAPMARFLATLDAEPWRERYYALADSPCFMVRRTSYPATIVRKAAGEVLRATAAYPRIQDRKKTTSSKDRRPISSGR